MLAFGEEVVAPALAGVGAQGGEFEHRVPIGLGGVGFDGASGLARKCCRVLLATATYRLSTGPASSAVASRTAYACLLRPYRRLTRPKARALCTHATGP
jgi:hypothetical protein